MPIFDSQYPVNSNPAGEDKILTTDTSDSSAVKSVTLTKVQEWLGSISKWITNGMIADGAVDTLQLANSAVTTGKIQNGAVTADKIDFATFVAFSVQMGSNKTTPSSTTFDVPFNTVEYDTGSNFNTSTYSFVVPDTGVYHFTANVSGSSVAGAIYLTVNGVQVRRPYYTGSVATVAPLSVDIKLNAGDVVKIQGYTASASTWVSSNYQQWFTGRRVA